MTGVLTVIDTTTVIGSLLAPRLILMLGSWTLPLLGWWYPLVLFDAANYLIEQLKAVFIRYRRKLLSNTHLI